MGKSERAAKLDYAVKKLSKKSSARITVCLLSKSEPLRCRPLLDMEKTSRARHGDDLPL
jgi:hypothetical protein